MINKNEKSLKNYSNCVTNANYFLELYYKIKNCHPNVLEECSIVLCLILKKGKFLIENIEKEILNGENLLH